MHIFYKIWQAVKRTHQYILIVYIILYNNNDILSNTIQLLDVTLSSSQKSLSLQVWLRFEQTARFHPEQDYHVILPPLISFLQRHMKCFHCYTLSIAFKCNYLQLSLALDAFSLQLQHMGKFNMGKFHCDKTPFKILLLLQQRLERCGSLFFSYKHHIYVPYHAGSVIFTHHNLLALFVHAILAFCIYNRRFPQNVPATSWDCVHQRPRHNKIA